MIWGNLNSRKVYFSLLYHLSCLASKYGILWRSLRNKCHCVKIVRIRSFSGAHFPELRFPVWIRKNTDQKNSEYGHFSRSVSKLCWADVLHKKWLDSFCSAFSSIWNEYRENRERKKFCRIALFMQGYFLIMIIIFNPYIERH